MDFWGHVYNLRREGLIAREWRPADLRPHLEAPQGRFSRNAISTIPYNRSLEKDGRNPGNYIKKGQSPKAWRVGKGIFQLIVDPEDDKKTQDAELTQARHWARRGLRRTPSGVSAMAHRHAARIHPQDQDVGAMTDFSLVDALIDFAQQPYDPYPGGRRTPVAKTGDLRSTLDAGEHWYTWPVDDDKLLEYTGIRLRSYSRLDKNIELKHTLHERFVQAPSDERTRIVKYYVEVFGGIRGLAPDILREYACDRAKSLASQGLERIASRSKALVLHDPQRYAIYDGCGSFA